MGLQKERDHQTSIQSAAEEGLWVHKNTFSGLEEPETDAQGSRPANTTVATVLSETRILDEAQHEAASSSKRRRSCESVVLYNNRRNKTPGPKAQHGHLCPNKMKRPNQADGDCNRQKKHKTTATR